MKTLLKRTWLAGLAAVFIAAPTLRAEINKWAPLAPDKPMNFNLTKSMRDPSLVTLPATVTTGEKLYAAWAEHSPSMILQVRVAVYQDKGTPPPTWKHIDTKVNQISRSAGLGINFDTNAGAWVTRLIVHKGKLYATWYEDGKSVGKIRVCSYNMDDDNPNWTFIDGGSSGGLNFNGRQNAVSPTAVSFGDQLVVFWSEAASTRTVSGMQLRARAYNGSQWVWLDGGTAAGLNIDPKLGANTGFGVVVQSKLYVSFRQSSSTGVRQLRVKVYKGGNQWQVVDGGNGLNHDPAKSATGQYACGDGSAIYCAWSEVNAAGVRQMRVARYDGSTDDALVPGWTRLDGRNPWGLNYNPAAEAISHGLQSYNGKIYLHWNEGFLFTSNEGSRRVAVWNHTEWAFADGGGPQSNVHLYETPTSTNAASFGVYGGQLLVFNTELFPNPQPSLGHVLVGMEATP